MKEWSLKSKMEKFDAEDVMDDKIVLKTERQLESLFELVKKEEIVLLRWDNVNEDKCSKIFPTEGLMARIKDGRFHLESCKETEEDD